MKKRFLNKAYLVSGCMVGVTMLAGGILTLPGVSADDSVVTTTTITVPVSCTISGIGMNSHTTSIENGRMEENIGTTTLKAYCNDNEGFSIYAVGYTGDTIGNTYLRDNTLGQTDDIQTSTTFSGANSAWAMKLGATTGTYTPIIAGSTADSEKQAGDTDYSTWAVVPSSYQRVAYRNSATDLDNGNIAAEGAQLTTTYAAYISPTQKAGTYVGKVKYTLVHPASEAPLQPQPATAGCINYFPNGSGVLGTMGCQSATDNASITLLASNFSRTGYGFAGWSDAYDYATNSSANFYGPQETITVPTGTTASGLSLYAVWVKSAGNIQSWNGCSSLTRADQATNIFSQSITALTDQRDSQTYAVAKLADGQCWMIENLRLEAEDTRDTSDIALSQGYNTTTFTGLADAESANFSNSTATNYKNTSTAYYGADGSGAEIIISASDHTYSSTDYSGYSFPRYNNTNTSSRASTPTDNSAAIYSYGNYYTWAAAIADTAFYRTNNQSITNTSLCPTGWRLPQGGNKTRITSNDDNDFWNLTVDALNGGTNPANYDSSTYPYYNGTDEATPVANKLRAFPNNFLYSGRFNASSANARGNYGYYWSSTANDYYNSYRLSLYSSNVYPGTNNNYKSNGYSIRCVSGS